MAASGFTLYNLAKKKLCDGTLDLDTDVFIAVLLQAASNAETATLGTYGSLTSEVANGNGYTTGGKSLTSITWAEGASAGEYRFDAADFTQTAVAGTISNVKYLVIKSSTNHLLCWMRLSSAQFDLTSAQVMTVQFSGNGIFELN